MINNWASFCRDQTSSWICDEGRTRPILRAQWPWKCLCLCARPFVVSRLTRSLVTVCQHNGSPLNIAGAPPRGIFDLFASVTRVVSRGTFWSFYSVAIKAKINKTYALAPCASMSFHRCPAFHQFLFIISFTIPQLLSSTSACIFLLFQSVITVFSVE